MMMFDDTLISIHAPTRGATQSKLMPIADMTLFQSTLPREERHCLIVKTSLYSYFNPRSHERSDLKRCKYMRYKIISIHAPTRGATFSLNEVLRCPDISIHAPTRGATVPASASHSSVVFQSTLPREERPGSFPAAVGLMLHFNPRSHERSDKLHDEHQTK